VKFERLTIVDEFDQWLNRARVAGGELELCKTKAAVERRDIGRRRRESDSTLWRRWDSKAGEKYPDLKSSEIRFAKVIFMDKGKELDLRSRRY
jgi:hypothetical protein